MGTALYKAHHCNLPDINAFGVNVSRPCASFRNSQLVDKIIMRFEGNSHKGLSGKMLDGQPDKLVDIETITSLHEALGKVISDYEASRP